LLGDVNFQKLSTASRSEEISDVRNIAENSPILSICSEQEIEPIHVSSTNLAYESFVRKRSEASIFSYKRTCANQLTRVGKKVLCFKDLLHGLAYTPLHAMFYMAILRSRRYLLTVASNNSFKRKAKRGRNRSTHVKIQFIFHSS